MDKGTKAMVDPHAGLGSSWHVVTEQLVTGKPESIPPGQLAALTESPMQLIRQRTNSQAVGRGEDEK